jgi:hypothetical protein
MHEMPNVEIDKDLNLLLSYYQKLNDNFIIAIDIYENILDTKLVDSNDIHTLTNLDINYEFYFLNTDDWKRYGEDIIKSIFKATLYKSYGRALNFFKDYSANSWEDVLSVYKVKLIKIGSEVPFLIDFITRLEINLTQMYEKYYAFIEIDDSLNLDQIYDFSKLNDEASEEKNLLKRKQKYVNSIGDIDLFCLEFELCAEDKEFRDDYIRKCKGTIKIVEFLIQNSTDAPLVTNSIIDESPKLSLNKFKVASKRKTDVIKILSAMYDARMFAGEDGKPLTNKQKLMEAFGEFLGDDFTSYSTSLTQAKNRDDKTFMKPFKEIEKEGLRYLNLESE